MTPETKATMEQLTEPREAVEWFARRMEEQLKKNDHKGGWEDEMRSYLARRLLEETGELMELFLKGNYLRSDIINECADVANFAMMIADNYRVKSHGR